MGVRPDGNNNLVALRVYRSDGIHEANLAIAAGDVEACNGPHC